MRYRTTPLLAAALIASAAAQAQAFVDGNRLYSMLTSASRDENAYALGFIVAATDSLHNEKQLSIKTCFTVPENATQGQIRDVTKAYLEKNPSGRHYPAAWLVAAALQDAFPCKR